MSNQYNYSFIELTNKVVDDDDDDDHNNKANENGDVELILSQKTSG